MSSWSFFGNSIMGSGRRLGLGRRMRGFEGDGAAGTWAAKHNISFHDYHSRMPGGASNTRRW